jgi:hypothetical protein
VKKELNKISKADRYETQEISMPKINYRNLKNECFSQLFQNKSSCSEVYRVRRSIEEKVIWAPCRRNGAAVAAESSIMRLATVPALVVILWVGVGGGVAAE